MSKFTHKVLFNAAFDKRKDPEGNYGVHGVEVTLLFKGPKGIVALEIFTNWMLPHVKKEHQAQGLFGTMFPMAANLGFHAYKPTVRNHPGALNCEFTKGKCYYHPSSLSHARDILDTLIAKGDEAVWTALKEVYYEYST